MRRIGIGFTSLVLVGLLSACTIVVEPPSLTGEPNDSAKELQTNQSTNQPFRTMQSILQNLEGKVPCDYRQGYQDIFDEISQDMFEMRACVTAQSPPWVYFTISVYDSFSDLESALFGACNTGSSLPEGITYILGNNWYVNNSSDVTEVSNEEIVEVLGGKALPREEVCSRY